jgi:hypothetical protein
MLLQESIHEGKEMPFVGLGELLNILHALNEFFVEAHNIGSPDEVVDGDVEGIGDVFDHFRLFLSTENMSIL